MEAIVLAGGFGTRLRSVVPDWPKPMAPVGGRPFLEILLNVLARKGFNRVILSLGHMADKIVSHFGSSYLDIELVYEIELTPLGTGGAVRQALALCRSDHAYVFNGDTYLDVEIEELESQWQISQKPIIVARSVADTARYGRLSCTDGSVTEFAEKGCDGPGLINAGCYVLPASIFDGYQLGDAFSLEVDFLSHAVSSQRFEVFVTTGQFIDIGVPEDFARAQTELIGVCL